MSMQSGLTDSSAGAPVSHSQTDRPTHTDTEYTCIHRETDQQTGRKEDKLSDLDETWETCRT